MTKRIAELTRENKEFALFVQKSLEQYRKGDWEDKDDEGRQLNSRFLESGMRLFSSYGSGRFPEIWITTKPDRSSSTIMFPEEDVSIEPLEHYLPGEGVESKNDLPPRNWAIYSVNFSWGQVKRRYPKIRA